MFDLYLSLQVSPRSTAPANRQFFLSVLPVADFFLLSLIQSFFLRAPEDLSSLPNRRPSTIAATTYSPPFLSARGWIL